MAETTEPARAVLRECCVCQVRLLGGTAVTFVETGSGPGRVLYACAPCVARQNLLPLDEQEHPLGDGRLQFRPKQEPARPSL